jgi:biopolymer transport protein ExbD
MSFAVSPKGGVKSDINVTPLVDVVLVLLIIFMVVTPLLHRGKDMTLPKARTTDQTKMPDAVVVSITRDRTIWVETTQVSREELRAALADAIRRNPDRKVLVKGDDALQVKDVRLVIADAKVAGVRGLSLAVEEVKR